MITLGTKSRERLVGVHPKLVAVVEAVAAAAPPELDFTVLEGVRSKKQMCVNYGKGRTAAQCISKGVPANYAQPAANKVTWLNDPFMSNHRVQADGFGHAVDLAPWPIDWNDKARFQALAELVLATAKKQKVHIRWGRDWDEDGRYEEKGETDGPHFELVNGG